MSVSGDLWKIASEIGPGVGVAGVMSQPSRLGRWSRKAPSGARRKLREARNRDAREISQRCGRWPEGRVSKLSAFTVPVLYELKVDVDLQANASLGAFRLLDLG